MTTLNYKKELEAAAKGMLLVHEPDALIKMILRTIVQKVRVSHAGILLQKRDEKTQKETYVLTLSRGPLGVKIPAGFVRLDQDNPLIRFFRENKEKKFFCEKTVCYEKAKKLLKNGNGSQLNKLLKNVLYQMEIFESVACIPSYVREELLGVLILGRKNNGKKFTQEELDFFIAISSNAAMAVRNAQLFTDLESELEKKHKLFIRTTVALAAAIDAKDHYTHGHIGRVAELCFKIAKKLKSKNKKIINSKFLEHLHIAALLHDIGKIGIPDSILNKKGPLTDEENAIMKQHPLLGMNILEPIKELEDSILGVKFHHERFDGTGYPQGLKGEEIPLIAAIVSVADAYDAMTTDRPYNQALPKEKAIEEIRNLSAKQFSPRVTEAFTDLYREGKI
ncbi:MAG: HD-GYP domain-containing protein [Candidatus Omnitrophica bacterium]|nr:HD-GYP domain-containing protein [Candidatus Omnitrophota bacterium]